MSNGAIDFSDLEEPAVWGSAFVGTKEAAKLVEVRKAPASIADYAGGKSVPNIAKFPCSKCRGSGRFISWAGRDVGACCQCKGSGKQKTDPNAARLRREKKEQEARERALQLQETFRLNNPEIAAWLEAKKDSFDFARSINAALLQWGSLTDGQLAAVRKCMARDEERAKAAAERKPDAEVGGAGFERMVAAFKAASASGLKWPKFKVGAYCFSPAGASSKNPGCLYVKRGSLYIGKITAAGAFFASRDATEEDKAEVARIGADPLAAAVMHGKQTGCCSCCGRELTNEESVRLGIGPICREKWGL